MADSFARGPGGNTSSIEQARSAAARRRRFLRPPRPGFALPWSTSGRHRPGSISAHGHPVGGSAGHGFTARYLAARRPLKITVIIGHRLRRARAFYGLRLRRFELG